MESIWTEKYRPKSFSEFYGQEGIIERIKALVEKKNLPHLLFIGPAGVGKTSLALVIAREVFGSRWSENFLELNASDERGIDVIRSKVKDFARTRAIGDVPFKIIYLDECDALTKEAQQALRRTMENYTRTCRFILSANYGSKIIDPIQSRCALFHFKPLEKEHIYGVIERVASAEGLSISSEAKESLYTVSEGDCRKLHNILQSCAALGKEITPELVLSVAGASASTELRKVLELALAGRFVDSRRLLLDVMLTNGLSGVDVIRQLQKEIWSLPLEPRKKVAIIDKCGEIEFRMVEGSDPYIQLEALLAHICAEGMYK